MFKSVVSPDRNACGHIGPPDAKLVSLKNSTFRSVTTLYGKHTFSIVKVGAGLDLKAGSTAKGRTQEPKSKLYTKQVYKGKTCRATGKHQGNTQGKHRKLKIRMKRGM